MNLVIITEKITIMFSRCWPFYLAFDLCLKRESLQSLDAKGILPIPLLNLNSFTCECYVLVYQLEGFSFIF